MILIQEIPSAITFAVKVHSRAKKNSITGELSNALKLALTAPPSDGRANGVHRILREILKVPRSSVTIASGVTSRNKVIRVADISVDELRTRLTV